MRALGRDGNPFELEADGLLAICIQHELDHLDGKLFVDYLSELKRTRIRKKLEKDKRNRPATAEARPDPRHLMHPLRIVFAGTPEFSVPALQALHDAGHAIVAVYTQPDRPAGRGREVASSAVKQRALALGIPVEQPPTLKSADAQQRLAAYAPDLMVVVAYGLILPQGVLDIPRLGCLNIHGSLLPRWRGAAPIQRAVLAGDERTGISIMLMDAGLDTGPELLRRELAIAPRETGGELHDRLAPLGAQAIVEAVAGLGRRHAARDAAAARQARPTPRRSARTRRASTGRNRPTRSTGRFARSIRGPSQRRDSVTRRCASGRRAR